MPGEHNFYLQFFVVEETELVAYRIPHHLNFNDYTLIVSFEMFLYLLSPVLPTNLLNFKTLLDLDLFFVFDFCNTTSKVVKCFSLASTSCVLFAHA